MIDTEDFIRDNYSLMTDRELSENLPMSLSTVNRIRNKMGLKSTIRPYNKHNAISLHKAAECYELWINGLTIIAVSKIVKLGPAAVNRAIDKFLPIRTPNPKVITLQSKINAD